MDTMKDSAEAERIILPFPPSTLLPSSSATPGFSSPAERKRKKFEGQRFEGNGLNIAIGMAIFDDVASGKITEELWLKACEFLGLRDKDFELKKCKKEEK